MRAGRSDLTRHSPLLESYARAHPAEACTGPVLDAYRHRMTIGGEGRRDPILVTEADRTGRGFMEPPGSGG